MAGTQNPDSLASPTRRKAPQGLVTLVFTDVQDSTELWENATDAMRIALELHNDILRQNLARSSGYEVKTEGDAFMVVFAAAEAALQWAMNVQQELLEAAWPATLLASASAREERDANGGLAWRGLRVRIGLHTGEPECRVNQQTGVMDYFGPVVNRAARVAGAARGGQILVSGVTWGYLEGHATALGKPVCLDLGEHWLKGLKTPERLFQISPQSLRQRTFPAVDSLAPPEVNEADPQLAGNTADPQSSAFDFFLSNSSARMDSSGRLIPGQVPVEIGDDGVAPPKFSEIHGLECAPHTTAPRPAQVPAEPLPPVSIGPATRSRGRRLRWATGLALVVVAGAGLMWVKPDGFAAMRAELASWLSAAVNRTQGLAERIPGMSSSSGAKSLGPSFGPTVLITSRPTGARVLIGGQEKGTTPLLIENYFPEKVLDLDVVLDGYETYTAALRGGQAQEFRVVLKPLKPAKGAKARAKRVAKE